MECNDLGLISAWQLWISASGPLSSCTLKGWPIFWLGRSGKVLAFVSGLIIILDIVGRDRITQFGDDAIDLSESVRARILPALQRAVASCLVRVIAPVKGLNLLTRPFHGGLSVNDRLKSYAQKDNGHAVWMNVLASLVMSFALLRIHGYSELSWQTAGVSVGIFSICVLFVAPLLLVLIILALMFKIFVLGTVWVPAIAWMLSHRRFMTAAKIVSLLLLLVGFHFDLLAS